MSIKSAGILLYHVSNGQLRVFLVHPGGPFWSRKDRGAWSIPKGVYDDSEDPLDAAKREFREETGKAVEGMMIDLGEIKQPSRKLVRAWACEGHLDATKMVSNLFELEWPPRSGKIKQFPEVDKGEWFEIDVARQKILKGQADFIDRLLAKLDHKV